MLDRLEITNFALIEKARIEGDPGFSVITGETGAGKSLLIGAIGAITGSRVNKELVQTGCDRARVEARFTAVDELLPPELAADIGLDEEDDNSVILSREIEVAGRTTCRLNGRIVPLSLFREIGSRLADIHGQNENQKLFDPRAHGRLLDRFAWPEIGPVHEEWTRLWDEYRALRKELSGFGLTAAERERELDMLRYQVNEIAKLNPKPGEEAKLEKHQDMQIHAEQLMTSLNEVRSLISSDEDGANMAGMTARCISLMMDVARLMPQAEEALENLSTCQDLLREVSHAVDGYLSQVRYDPGLLDKINARLDRLQRLKKKYGPTLEEVLAYSEKTAERIEMLEQSETRLQELTERSEKLHERLLEQGARLTAIRAESGRRLAEKICAELADLGMAGVRFETGISPKQPAPDGMDEVEFLISTNPGEPLKALARIASGGEAARIMLAIKVIIADADKTPLLIFDEVDAGISGRTSELVGRKLHQLSEKAQVFCVTHTAQIAAMADRQLMIQKQPEGDKIRTSIRLLSEEERVDEVARLLSGDSAVERSRELATELLASRAARD